MEKMKGHIKYWEKLKYFENFIMKIVFIFIKFYRKI